MQQTGIGEVMPESVHPWSGVVPEVDLERYARAGFGRRGGLGSRPALLVIDVQYQFTGPGPMPIDEAIEVYPRACGEAAWRSVHSIARMMEAAHSNDVPVVYISIAPRRTGVGRLNAKAPNPFVDGEAYEIVREIAPREGDTVLEKWQPSAFFGTSLLSHLIDMRIDTVILTGCTTTGCVLASAVDAYSYNFRVAVAESGVFDRSEFSHAVGLFDIDSKYGDVMTEQEIVGFLHGHREEEGTS